MTSSTSANNRDELIAKVYQASEQFTWSRHDESARVEGYLLRASLNRWLPTAAAAIADVGGGNGRWAFELADAGYSVALSDVTTALIDDARQRQEAHTALASCEVADARALPYADETFDGYLQLGPLYSVETSEDRARVLAEAIRVLKPGGVLVAQYLTRFAGLRNILSYAAEKSGLFNWQEYLETGVLNGETVPVFFRANTWLTEDEILKEIDAAGFELVAVQGMDAPAPGHGQEALESASSELVAQWGEISLALGQTTAGRGASDHLLVIAHKLSQVS